MKMHLIVVSQRAEAVKNGLPSYLLKALAVLVFWTLLSASALAEKRSKKLPETGHVAVFFSDDRGMFAWPILTVSKSVDGDVSVSKGKFEVSLCAHDDLACNESLDKCRDPVKPCPVNKTTVQAVHGMKHVPRAWFDSSGETFSVTGGVLVPAPFGEGVQESAGFSRHLLGFSIAGEHFANEFEKRPIVLADRFELIRTKSRTQLDAATRSYIRQLIERWKSGQSCHLRYGSCDEINELTNKPSIKGEVISFELSRGRRLEYLTAKTAVVKGRQKQLRSWMGDYLKIEIWRLRTKNEEKILDLHLGADAEWRVFDERVNCGTLCLFEWSPEVLEIGERIFVVGPGRVGTDRGYYAFELIGSTLQRVSAYGGGF